jgi:hypothetical protein
VRALRPQPLYFMVDRGKLVDEIGQIHGFMAVSPMTGGQEMGT